MSGYIKTHRTKYVECAIPGCRESDGQVDVVISLADDDAVLYIPVCHDTEHLSEAFKVKHQFNVKKYTLETIDKLNEILDLSQVYMRSSNEVAMLAPREIQTDVAPPSWSWVDDFGYWRITTGEKLAIELVSDRELEDAAVAIQEANISRVTKRIQWIKEIKENAGTPHYGYPPDELEVGQEEAYAKLEEIYEVLEGRGLILA